MKCMGQILRTIDTKNNLIAYGTNLCYSFVKVMFFITRIYTNKKHKPDCDVHRFRICSAFDTLAHVT